MNENELTHHGVKGMKWGVRRTKEQLARLAGRGKKKPEQPAAKKTASTQTSAKGSSTKATSDNDEEQISTKTLKDRNERLRLEKEYKQMLMSDDDLKQRVERLRLEKEYKQLTAKEKSKGRQLVEGIVTAAVAEVGKTFVKNALSNLVNKVTAKSGSSESSHSEAASEAAKSFFKEAFGGKSKRSSNSSQNTNWDDWKVNDTSPVSSALSLSAPDDD